MAEPFDLDVTVLGGCGHVGLPLALALSDRGLKTAIYDISEVAVERVARGEMPFQENGAAAVLERRITDATCPGTLVSVVATFGTASPRNRPPGSSVKLLSWV